MIDCGSWFVFWASFVLCFMILQNLVFSTIVVNVALCILAGYLADALSKSIANAAPRKLISRLEDKAVLITGCDSGFGHALAKRLDQKGMKVYAGCLFPNGDGAKELIANCSDQLRIVGLDVTKDEDCRNAAAFVTDTLGGREFWAVVNNAGIAVITEIEWCPVPVYQRILDVNALGPIRVTKAFLPLLRRTKGRVVITASLAGRCTFPGFSAYSMSKYAAVSFADGLRREMKKWGVSVHTIEPTLYKTPITEEALLTREMHNMWEELPGEIQTSYGLDYFKDFQAKILHHLRQAKPISKIEEVISDLEDAIIGENPKYRYVPNVVTQLRARILSSLPTEIQDMVLCQSQPKTPPAELSPTRRLSRVRKPSLIRYMSLPAMAAAGSRPAMEVLEEENIFNFNQPKP